MSEPGGVPAAALLGELAAAARDVGVRAWLVGGAVRDRLLGRAPVDLDVAVEARAKAASAFVARVLSGEGWSCGARHERFGTATLRAPGGERVDVAATREETYPYPGALPDVTAGVPIGRDLGRRDFTIHAMALPLGEDGTGERIVDPFGGREDLARRVVRLLHERSIADDPTRVFRAARYAARLGFVLDGGFDDAMRRAVDAGAFGRISGDRLRRALEEVLSEENRVVAVGTLDRLAVPGALVAGWAVAVPALDALRAAASPGEAWAALLAPLPPDLRRSVASRLSFSRALRRATGCPA